MKIQVVVFWVVTSPWKWRQHGPSKLSNHYTALQPRRPRVEPIL